MELYFFNKMNFNFFIFTLLVITYPLFCQSGGTNTKTDLYRFNENMFPRCVNFENKDGAKSSGGKENKGAKGHAFEKLNAGEKVTLCDIKGCGIINHIWVTIANRDPKTLRGIKIEMYWDNAKTPAVQAPFGDFFCNILGKTSSFENELFSNPEGKSFNCYIQMPFRKAAKIVLTNETDSMGVNLFYDIDYVLTKPHGKETLYFHAYWRRETETKLTEDYVILPEVKGKGRYLGAHIGVITNPIYNDLWWGEGESKIYLDDDAEYPTLIGTGTEDYPGSGWGIGVYANRYQGCLSADQKKGEYSFYRYHIPDPIFFNKKCKAVMQVMGGGRKKDVIEALDRGALLIPVTVGNSKGFLKKLLEMNPIPNINSQSFPDGWVNFFRSDDWSSVAFFYLNLPEDGLPKIADAALRIKKIGESK
jgi:Protein of unknown function (DUF2961).